MRSQKYGKHEPDANQQAGVYARARPEAMEYDATTFHVPRAFGEQFFLFLGRFLAEPMENPVFAREWRRYQRRWRWAGAMHWAGWTVLLMVLSGLIAIALTLTLQRLGLGPQGTEWIFVMVYLAPAPVLSLIGFFAGVAGCSLLQNRAAIEQAATTLLHPQEIAFGYLAGAVLPRVLPWVVGMPVVLMVGIDVFVVGRGTLAFGPWTLLAYALSWVPFMASTVLASAALAASLSFAEGNSARAVGVPLTLWIVLGFVGNGLVLVLCLTPWLERGSPLLPFFLLGVPVLTLYKLVIAGAFVHHLAVRMAGQAWVRE